MSSDFYSSSLSRNLVRTGAFGYRENTAVRDALDGSEEVEMREHQGSLTLRNVLMLADLGWKAKAASQFVFRNRYVFVG
jgi:hypothetical protein